MTIDRRQVGIVSDGKANKIEVREGDRVELLPTHPEKPDGEDRRYLSHGQAEALRRFLEVDGPYTISWIRLWTCGTFNLYFKIPGREPGALSRDFRPAEPH